MDELHIAIASQFVSRQQVEQIALGDKRLKVWNITRQVSTERDRGQPDPELDPILSQVEIIYGSSPPLDVMSRAPKLKWFHVYPVGINKILGTDLWSSSVIITNSRGAATIPCSEYVIAAMFMLARQMPRFLANQQQRNWQRLPLAEMAGKTVGIIGLGNIGKRVARAAKALQMVVMAIRRSQTVPAFNEENVDELLSPQQLPHLLARSDFVVLTLPLTPQTTRLIGQKELQTMKPTAYLINISRGEIVNQAALVSALKQGQIAGAALDVFEKEPLPRESELWEMPNVVLTPHIGADTVESSERHIQLFQDNLRRYLAGQELINIVNRAAGY